MSNVSLAVLRRDTPPQGVYDTFHWRSPLRPPLHKGYTTHFIGGHTILLAVTSPVIPLPSETQKGRRSNPRSPQTGPSIPGRVCTVYPPWVQHRHYKHLSIIGNEKRKQDVSHPRMRRKRQGKFLVKTQEESANRQTLCNNTICNLNRSPPLK
jgi:hypothetical protein